MDAAGEDTAVADDGVSVGKAGCVSASKVDSSLALPNCTYAVREVSG
jgi:hypothetical protein